MGSGVVQGRIPGDAQVKLLREGPGPVEPPAPKAEQPVKVIRSGPGPVALRPERELGQRRGIQPQGVRSGPPAAPLLAPGARNAIPVPAPLAPAQAAKVALCQAVLTRASQKTGSIEATPYELALLQDAEIGFVPGRIRETYYVRIPDAAQWLARLKACPVPAAAHARVAPSEGRGRAAPQVELRGVRKPAGGVAIPKPAPDGLRRLRGVLVRAIQNPKQEFLGNTDAIKALKKEYKNIKIEIVPRTRAEGDDRIGFRITNAEKALAKKGAETITSFWTGAPTGWRDEFGQKWKNGDVVLGPNWQSSVVIRNGKPETATKTAHDAEVVRSSAQGPKLLQGSDLSSSFMVVAGEIRPATQDQYGFYMVTSRVQRY